MKFFNLLKKELGELINKQMIIGLAVMMIILMLMGNIMKTTVSEAMDQSLYTINLADNDNTELTEELIASLKENNVKVKLYNDELCSKGEYPEFLSKNELKNIIVIPEGFTDSILNGKKDTELISVSAMSSAASLSNISNSNSSGISAINQCMRDILAKRDGISAEQLERLNSPVSVSEKTVVADKSAAISMDTIMGKVMMQNMILPIVVFVLIMMTSQMLISAISNEKIDKTLETLLSTPISRTAVISAKMLAAAVVALLNAAVYMMGFSVFISGTMDGVTEEVTTPAVGDFISVESALAQLGLTLTPVDYLLVGVQLFLTIMICLSVSLILGALVNDTKSSQNMITPILMLAMVPYLISMLTDINSLPLAARIAVYAIPFTHTFSSIPNLMFGNDMLFFCGIIYQTIVFLVCMFFALRLFKSDKIFTISLNFGQKAKFRKNSSAE